MITPADPPPPRRRHLLRVSLRGLMVLVVLVGIPAGWLANTIRTQREAIAAIRAAGGIVRFSYQEEVASVNAQGRPVKRTEPAAPAWVRRCLGDELFQTVQSVSFPKAVPGAVFARVARFDRLEVLEMTDCTAIDPEAHHLRDLHRLRRLYLAGPGVTDAVLAEVAHLPSLRSLQLARASAGAAAFGPLAALPELDYLAINNTPGLTDAGGAVMVAGLPRLRTLQLVGFPRLAATLDAVGRFHPDLETLILQESTITDDDLAAVGRIRNLEQLNIQKTPITDAGLAHLRPLKKLRYLLANGRGLTDEGLRHLGACAALKDLTVAGATMSDAGLVHLAGLPLTRLNIGATQITDAGMPTIARITSLEELGLLRNPALTDAALVPLRDLKQLRRLDVRGTGITAGGVATLRQALPGLTRVQTGATSTRPPTPTAP